MDGRKEAREQQLRSSEAMGGQPPNPRPAGGACRLGSGVGEDGGPSRIPGLERVGFVCRRGQGAPLTHGWAHAVPGGVPWGGASTW